MSMYNMLHGQNPISGVLLAILDIDQPNGEWDSGRFRDIFLNEDGTRISLYTRNGGGNRNCWHRDDSWYAGPGCKHESRTEKVKERVELTEEEAKQHPDWKALNIFIGNKRTYETGNMVDEVQYRCLAPDSDQCACPGCIVCYKLPQHPNYISDYDDDYDCTYATIEFSVPEKFLPLTKGLATGEKPMTISEKFEETFKEMKQMDADAIRKDARFAPIASMLTELVSQPV